MLGASGVKFDIEGVGDNPLRRGLVVKVYRSMLPGDRHTVYIQPGNDFPRVEAFFEDRKFHRMLRREQWAETVRVAKVIGVQFVNGRAIVGRRIGQYMLTNGIAFRHPQPPLDLVGASRAIADQGESWIRRARRWVSRGLMISPRLMSNSKSPDTNSF